MRRLIVALFCWSIGIRVRTNTQHIADLERMLSDLVSARDALDAEIIEATRRLLMTQVVRDAIGKQRGIWMRDATAKDKALPIIPQPEPERRSL